MDSFMLIFHSPKTQEEAYAQQSPDELQAELQKWQQWLGGLAAQGKLDHSDALLPTGKVMTRHGQVVTDGPYTEGKEIVGGYTLIKAANIDEAVQLAAGCPVLENPDASLEVRPLMQFEE